MKEHFAWRPFNKSVARLPYHCAAKLLTTTGRVWTHDDRTPGRNQRVAVGLCAQFSFADVFVLLGFVAVSAVFRAVFLARRTKTASIRSYGLTHTA